MKTTKEWVSEIFRDSLLPISGDGGAAEQLRALVGAIQADAYSSWVALPPEKDALAILRLQVDNVQLAAALKPFAAMYTSDLKSLPSQTAVSTTFTVQNLRWAHDALAGGAQKKL